MYHYQDIHDYPGLFACFLFFVFEASWVSKQQAVRVNSTLMILGCT